MLEEVRSGSAIKPRHSEEFLDFQLANAHEPDTVIGQVDGSSLLLSIQEAVRTKVLSSRGRYGDRERQEISDSQRLMAQHLTYLETEGVVVSPKLLHSFAVVAHGYALHSESAADEVDAGRVQAAALLMRNRAAFAAVGAYNADKAALHQAPLILEELDEAIKATPDFFYPRDTLFILDRNPADPLGAAASHALRYKDFRNTIEPALRAKYGYKGEFSRGLIHSAIFSHTDSEAFFERWFTDRALVGKAYPDVDQMTIDKMMNNKDVRSVVVPRLQAPLQEVQLTDRQKDSGRLVLTKLRSVYCSDNITIGRVGWGTRELTRQLRFNCKSYEDAGVDVAEAANYMHRLLRYCDAPTSKAYAFTGDINSAVAVFKAYADDMLIYQQLPGVKPELAYMLAHTMEPATYSALVDTYRQRIGISAAGINNIARRNSRNLESTLDAVAEFVPQAVSEYGDILPEIHIKRALVLMNGDIARVRKALVSYRQDFPGLYRDLAGTHPWLDIEWTRDVFLQSKDPRNTVRHVVESVSYAMSKHPTNQYVTLGACRVIMRASRHEAKLTANQKISDYLDRVETILNSCRSIGVSFPKEYVISWAAMSRRKASSCVPDHMAACAQVQDSAQAFGGVDSHIASLIAIKWPDTSRIHERLGTYFRNREVLRRDTEFNPMIEDWMVDEAAVASSVPLARTLLAWKSFVASMERKRDGAGVGVGDRFTVQRQAVDRQADRATQVASQQQDMALVLDSSLGQLDAEAVKIVFGFETSYSEEQLAEELGVNDLGEYVQTQLLPGIKQRLLETVKV